MLVTIGLVAVGWVAFVPSAQEPGYEFVTAWGEKGSKPGQFRDPTGIVVAGDEVFVADARNARIQVFDTEGNFKRQFGKSGDGVAEFGRPMNLAVAGGELYVADYWHDRIAVFGLDGTSKRSIGKKGSGPGQFNAPGGVAISSAGQVLVADFYNQRVQELKPNGEFVRQWGDTGKAGIRQGLFNYPTDVALAPDGTFYVADGYNDRVQAFSRNGRFSHKWGGPFAMNIFGPFNGWFTTVTGIAVDRQGNVFVADFYNHRIQKFSSDGTFLSAFGHEGSDSGEFNYPTAVTVGDDGAVFVTDFGNQRVQKWRLAG